MNRSELSDESLLRRYLASDDLCAEEFFRRYARKLALYVLRLGSRTVDLNEVVQLTFVAFFEDLTSGLPKFDLARPVEPWLRAIAKRKYIDLYRKQKRQRELENEYCRLVGYQNLVDNETPLDTLIKLEIEQIKRATLAEIRQYIARIPAQDRNLVSQRLFDKDFSYRKFCMENSLDPSEERIHELRGRVFRILSKTRKFISEPELY